MDTMENPVSFWPKAIRWGLIGGLVSIIFSLIINTFGLLDMSKGFIMPMLVGLVGFAITIIIIVLAVRAHREEDLGGYIPFGKAFAVGFFVALISGVISVIFSYLYATVINPDFAAEFMAGMETFMEQQGVPEAQMADAIARTEAKMTPMGMVKSGLMNSVIGGAIIALIVGAIMKKKAPEGPIDSEMA